MLNSNHRARLFKQIMRRFITSTVETGGGGRLKWWRGRGRHVGICVLVTQLLKVFVIILTNWYLFDHWIKISLLFIRRWNVSTIQKFERNEMFYSLIFIFNEIKINSNYYELRIIAVGKLYIVIPWSANNWEYNDLL